MIPAWYPSLKRTMQLQDIYPGVAPWEWEAHPIERDRVLCILHAEVAAERMLAERAARDAEDVNDPTA